MVMRDDGSRPREPRFGPVGPRDPYADRVDDDLRDEAGYDDSEDADAGDAYGHEGEEAPPRSRRGLIRTVVVTLAVFGFGGIIAYSYTQGDRVGTEVVAPVLRADPSPTKVRPEQPGGMDVPHQDKLVYERLNPGSTPGEARVERLLPPPEEPLDRPRAAVEQELGAPEPAEEDVTIGIPPEELAVDAPPAAELPQAAEQALVEPPPAVIQAPPAGTPSPAEAAARQSAPPQTAALPPPKLEEPKAEPPTGTARVQVGAVDSEAKAQSEWARLQRLHAAELGGLGLTVQRVDLGARGIFHRIQGGPVSDFRAAEICAALKDKGVGCMVVR